MGFKPDKKLVALCGKARDNAISAAEFEQLETRLLEDADARAFYTDFMTVHALLERSDLVTEERHVPHERSDLVTEEFHASLERSDPDAAEFHAPPRARRWLLAAAAALLIFCALVATRPHRPAPTLDPIARLGDHRNIQLIRDGENISTAENAELYIGDELITAAGAQALLGFDGEDTMILVAENTQVRLERSRAGGKLVTLLTGSVSCDVDEQPTGKPMLLDTRHGLFTVLGTQFTLNAQSESSTLIVLEGSVRVEAEGEVAQVDGGSRASVRPRQIEQAPLLEIEPAAGVKSLALVQAPEHKAIPEFSPIKDGAVIDLAALPTRSLNIEALVDGEHVSCVRFKLKAVDPNGRKLTPLGKSNRRLNGHGEIYTPFMLAGDYDNPPEPVRPFAWTPKPGSYTLTATSYENPRYRGRTGPPLTVRFRIIDSGSSQ